MARLTVPVSVTARHDKRLMRAGDEAELLWYRLLQLAKTLETDGVIPMPLIVKEHRRAEKALAALVSVGLVRDLGDDDYELAGWLDWNPSKADLERKRADDRERKRRNPSGSRPEGTKDSERIPAGIPADSDGSPFGGFADSAAVKGREGKGREEANDSVGTSTVRSPAGSAPRLRSVDPAPLGGSLGAVLGGLR